MPPRLRRLVDEHGEAFARMLASEPTLFDREVAATALRSFYSGIELIMRGVAESCDGGIEMSARWHAALLVSMSSLGAIGG